MATSFTTTTVFVPSFAMLLTLALVGVVLFPSHVKTSVVASAYAALIFATDTASRLFFSCDVKIGILIATKTPIIATTTSSSAGRNYMVILSHKRVFGLFSCRVLLMELLFKIVSAVFIT